jgi:hypothetical protein
MVQTKCGFDDLAGRAPGSHLLVFHGPTLFVAVGFNPQFVPTGVNPPNPAALTVQALVDTGATESCIDNLVAAQLNLPIIDRRQISGVHGANTVNMHMAQIFVPSLAFWIYGVFAGVDLAAGGQVHRALIGRTFLRNFTMIYEGRTGTVTIHND